MFLKVCGITRPEDARNAVRHGATALGFVFWRDSPRHVSHDRAAEIIDELSPDVTPVGVFVNQDIDVMRETIAQTGIRMVQLHGDEPPGYATALEVPVIRAVSVDKAGEVEIVWPSETTLLIDAIDPRRRGGTGQTVDWQGAAAVARRRRVVLAGGLTPLNIAEAIAEVRPYGIDVSSGVEVAPGIKDDAKMAQLLGLARGALARQRSTGSGRGETDSNGR